MKLPRISALDLREPPATEEWTNWDEITWPWGFLFDGLAGMREATQYIVFLPADANVIYLPPSGEE
jgi:hypothetical protein